MGKKENITKPPSFSFSKLKEDRQNMGFWISHYFLHTFFSFNDTVVNWKNRCIFNSPHLRICLLILQREKVEKVGDGGRGKHWFERETSIGCLSYILWLGIEPAAFWCMGWCSNQLSHWAKAILIFMYSDLHIFILLLVLSIISFFKRSFLA